MSKKTLLALIVAIICMPICDNVIPKGYVRSHKQYDTFRTFFPCPSTGKSEGACPGYQVDHIKALENGGEDSYKNMQWLSIKQHRDKTLIDNAEHRNQHPP